MTVPTSVVVAAVRAAAERVSLADACRAACGAAARARGWGWDAPPLPAEMAALDWAQVDPLSIGDAYAACLAEAKKQGAYFTPWPVAQRVAALAVREGDRVIDPTCGAGHLLRAAVEHMGGDPVAIVEDHIFGLDLDPVAVELCRFTLLHATEGRASRILLAANIRVANALTDPWSALSGGTFDAVVSNPPYRAGRLSGLTVASLSAHAPTAEYQVDPYLVVMDRALRALRPGGRAALVVPNAWSSNHRTGALRAWLTAENTLERVVELPVDTFDASVETVITVCQRGGETPARVPLEALDGTPTGHLLFDRAHPAAPLALARDEATRALLEAARGWTATLGDVAEVTRGVNPYHRLTHTPEQIAARVHHADHQVAPDWQPELRGRDLVAPYRVAWTKHWIHYGPWLKEPRKPRFFEGPRLLVRKIIGRTLHAAFIDTPMICDQSVYIARLTPSEWSPWTLLGCVNSALMAQLLRARHQEDDQLFPQLKVRELRGMPLPPADPTGPLAQAVAEAAEARHRGEHIDVEPLVWRLYGLESP